MRVGFNIFTVNCFLGMLRFGVEHAPPLLCDSLHVFPFGVREDGSDLRVGRELPTPEPMHVIDVTRNQSPHDRDQLGQGSWGTWPFSDCPKG